MTAGKHEGTAGMAIKKNAKGGKTRMFGSKAKELESLLVSTKLELEKATEEKKKLEKDLASVKGELKQMKDMVNNSDAAKLEAKAKETIAEYEGLKEMYNQKIRSFDDSKEESEQSFAREAALKRHHLDNEIADTKQASQQFVSETVSTFSETYNYYLNQIKVLMDALSQVAVETGKTLFAHDADNLKVNFSQQMAETLKSGKDSLAGEDGDLIVIGASEEDMDMLEIRSTEPDAEAPVEIPETDAEGSTEEAGGEKTGEISEETAEEIADELRDS